MELTQKLSNIESLLPILDKFRKSKQASIDLNQQQLLKDTYFSIYGIQPVMNCVTCIIEHLHQLLAYHEKHSPVKLNNPPEPLSKSKKKAGDCCKSKV